MLYMKSWPAVLLGLPTNTGTSPPTQTERAIAWRVQKQMKRDRGGRDIRRRRGVGRRRPSIPGDSRSVPPIDLHGRRRLRRERRGIHKPNTTGWIYD